MLLQSSRRANLLGQIVWAVGYDWEPRPTNDLEDGLPRRRPCEGGKTTPSTRTIGAERRITNAKRQTLPQSFDLLQHSFGDLADLAGSQEREMQQLEQ